MKTSGKESDTTPTALQSTSIEAARPKLIIGGSIIIVLIIILLEVYAPRERTNTSGAESQTDTTIIPAAIEPSVDALADESP